MELKIETIRAIFLQKFKEEYRKPHDPCHYWDTRANVWREAAIIAGASPAIFEQFKTDVLKELLKHDTSLNEKNARS